MKLTKFLAFGLAALCMSLTFTSCLNNDDDDDYTATYTDYMMVKTDGTQCTADDGNSYSIDNYSEVAALTANLTHSRAFMMFTITYSGTDGTMKGGFQVGGMSNCFMTDALTADDMPDELTSTEHLVGVSASYSGVTSAYLNLYVNSVNYDTGGSSTSTKSPQEDLFKAYVTKVSGNEVYVGLYYDNEGTGTTSIVQQPISVSIKSALEDYRGEITPDSDGKIKVILDNDNSVTGTYTWK